MSKLIARFAKNESGATAIEYALIAGIMATALITALGLLGDNMDTAFTDIADSVKVEK